MVSPDEGWAAGYTTQGVIMHYAKGAWTIAYTIPPDVRKQKPVIQDIWMTSPTQGLAVGTKSFGGDNVRRATILRFDGRTWAPASNMASVLQGLDLYSISLVSATEGWAVGGSQTGGNMVHYKDGVWVGPTANELSLTDPAVSSAHNWASVEMVSATEGWAIGYADDSNGKQVPSIWHFHEGHWARIGQSTIVTRIGLASPTEWWGVGDGFCHYEDGKLTA
jgi:hypothetical protein